MSSAYVRSAKETSILVKMISPKRGANPDPPVVCSLCGKLTDVYVIRVLAKLKIDICYICASDIQDACMYDTYCLADECGEPLPVPAIISTYKNVGKD